MKLVSAKELIENYKAPISSVQLLDDWYCIDTGIPGYSYDFEASRCKTAEQLVGWVRQISEKTWCTVDMVSDLIAAWAVYSKTEIH